MKTPISSDTKLTKDEECESIDSTKYQGMIGSLLYLTASRPDIMFSVCLCARFQEAPKTSHLEAVKHIFRYIKGTTHLGLWYPKGTGIETAVYADSDHVGDYVDRKSTSEMDRRFADSRIKANGAITFNGDVNEMQGYLFVDFAKKIINIDGKVLKKYAPRMAVRGVCIDKDKVIASPSLEQVVSPFKLVSFAEQVCITPMKDYQMETDDPLLKSVSIDENNSSDYGTNQLSVVDQPNGSANNNTTDVLKVHIGDVNGSPMLKEADPKVKVFANVVEGANGVQDWITLKRD
ncbi:hypothetical protein Tco_0547847 [Tanacetum coccineum]